MSNIVIQCFEHERWPVPEEHMGHFESLVSFNDRNGNRFFDVGNRCIKFRHYVGVIQVGNLTLEILPKLDRESGDKTKMRDHLISMLHRTGILPLEDVGPASLHTIHGSLFDLYLELFLRRVRQIVHAGIPKRYSLVQGNERFLRGHLLMNRHIMRNMFDKSKFFEEYQHFSKDNLLNQILKRALAIVALMPVKAARDARNLLTFFEDVENREVNPQDFGRVNYTRNTECCRTAVNMAEIIITNHQPDLRKGAMAITSLLFDMNRLFELYVSREIVRRRSAGIQVKLQHRQVFWSNDDAGNGKTIRPDIIVAKDGKTFVLDTKWKLFDGKAPSDADLKQLYAYSLQLKANRVILIYPSPGQDFMSSSGFFSESDGIHDMRPVSVWRVPLLSQNGLNNDLGRDILCRLTT